MPPIGRYIIAVSGGVDSMTLLHILRAQPEIELIVAHFDHGIREDSAEDAKFVGEVAKEYGLKFETKREELGANASEDLARTRRYEFLRDVAKKHKAKIVTAHHADDAVETVAINTHRGTGWRGLASMDSDIVRPLLNMSKQHILEYAKKHNLKWREDSTNKSDNYLRNRIRHNNNLSDDEKLQILALRADQIRIKKEVDEEVKALIGDGPDYSRYFFTHVTPVVAVEMLRYITRAMLTRPQLKRALVAIKTLRPGTIYEAGAHVKFSFTSRNFTVKLIK